MGLYSASVSSMPSTGAKSRPGAPVALDVGGGYVLLGVHGDGVAGAASEGSCQYMCLSWKVKRVRRSRRWGRRVEVQAGGGCAVVSEVQRHLAASLGPATVGLCPISPLAWSSQGTLNSLGTWHLLPHLCCLGSTTPHVLCRVSLVTPTRSHPESAVGGSNATREGRARDARGSAGGPLTTQPKGKVAD